MHVVSARERGGLTRAWVAKQEHHPIPQFMKALETGTVVFADKGKWTEIRKSFALVQVAHKVTYYTPEACTNFAESGFNVFRVLATIHRHVVNTYFDLYAAQLAWRLDRVRMNDDEGFASILKAMMVSGRSEMAGYFLPKKKGGHKRRCQIVLEDGSNGELFRPRSQQPTTERRPLGARPRPPRSTPVRDEASASQSPWRSDG